MVTSLIFFGSVCTVIMVTLIIIQLGEIVRGPIVFLPACFAGALALVTLIGAACLQQHHWNQHCHRLGGVITHGGDCVKPHSIIDIP